LSLNLLHFPGCWDSTGECWGDSNICTIQIPNHE
jgi:hypothetical protein